MFNEEILFLLKGMLFFIGSISDMGTFPPTLSAEEEHALLVEVSKGNVDAKTKLIEHNLRLVVHIAKRFSNTDIDIDDLISIGTIGLIKAIEKFDVSKQAKLATFASTCIENEILMKLRAAKKDHSNVSLSDCLGADDEGNEMLYSEIFGVDDSEFHDRLDSESDIRRLRELISTCLSDIERTVLELRYGLRSNRLTTKRVGLTQQEVADRLDISRSYVSRIETRALNKLADKFGLKKGKN